MFAHSNTGQDSPEYLAEDRGKTLVAVCILFIFLDTIFVALRFYGQRIARTPLGVDDFIIPFAWFTHIGLCILGIIMVREAGVGRHLAYILRTDPTKLEAWAKSLYALEWLYLPSVALPKISILLLYLRILVDRPYRIATHVLIWMMVANWIGYLVASSLQCTPFEYLWNKKIDGKCIDQSSFYKTVSAPNIVTDVLILLLPLKTLLGLQVSRSQKAGLILIFSSGSVYVFMFLPYDSARRRFDVQIWDAYAQYLRGIIASCFRMASFFQPEVFVDSTWTSVKLVGWSIVEPGMYLIAACSVRLRPVIVKFAERMHLKDLCNRVSQKILRGGGRKNDIILGVIPSSHAGFARMHKGGSEHKSLVENSRGEPSG